MRSEELSPDLSDAREENLLWQHRLVELKKKYAQVKDVNGKLSKDVAELKTNVTEMADVRRG